MKHFGILSLALAFVSAHAGEQVLGTFDRDLVFSAHTPKKALRAGLPVTPVLKSIKIFKESNLAAPQAQVTLQESAQSVVRVVTAPLKVISKKDNGMIVQVEVMREGSDAITCGPHSFKAMTLQFRMGYFAEFVMDHSLTATVEKTDDDCHEAYQAQEFNYSVDE
jgi:hypothetical protein